MGNTLARRIGVLSLFGALSVLGHFGTAMAQVKPELDPGIPSYTRTAGVSGSLKVVGSETMKPITSRWESRLRDIYPGLAIQNQAVGSETAPPALLQGTAQIAAMSRKMTGQEINTFRDKYGYEPTEVPVAVDVLAIYVHRDNPIAGLTLQELDAIYSMDRRRGLEQGIIEWGQLGLSGEWADQQIRLHGRNPLSGTATFFRDHVCLGGEFKESMKTEPGSASVVLEVMKDRFAIGFSSLGYRTSTVKPVPLAETKSSRAIEPTFETAIDGSYPLRRFLYLYVNKPPKATLSPAVSEFVKFAVSREGQQVIVKEGFFPLPTSELNRLFAIWSQPLQAVSAPPRPPAIH